MELREVYQELNQIKDYPPRYNKLGEQYFSNTLETAKDKILRMLYTKINTISSVPNIWIDIERYKHMLDNEISIRVLENSVKEKITRGLAELNPYVELYVDKEKQACEIWVVLEIYKKKVKMKISNAQDPRLFQIEIDRKRFYA